MTPVTSRGRYTDGGDEAVEWVTRADGTTRQRVVPNRHPRPALVRAVMLLWLGGMTVDLLGKPAAWTLAGAWVAAWLLDVIRNQPGPWRTVLTDEPWRVEDRG